MAEKENNKEKSVRKKKKVPQKVNRWKVAFLIMIGILIGTCAFIGLRVTQVREPNYRPAPIADRQGKPVLTMQSNKQQVNDLIDFFLSDFQEGSDIKYKFYLENEALLNGTFNVLGHPIQFYLYFDPYVMNDGNVQLKAKSLSIGTLGLPIKEILKFVQRDYKLPNWVEVDPSESLILLRLDQFRMQNGLFVRAEKINLVDDDIRMNIYLPKENNETSSKEND
ncbi:YpmS family protein [Enterococcus rivorum]|uniref:DUF2140 domain-containing protein n=1 Tax=Enterococcus rivorum TaxID=762845 RepID=A0A1E5KVT2_9ENTE|nr:YpmS family protein [Enterococcus rivorum]MBP2100313.1 uncharacterized protein YpmS [Enterococcus rivorum]OEH81940.1 hypothetical protein BCR26_15265 [Enterococcus rivorum]